MHDNYGQVLEDAIAKARNYAVYPRMPHDNLHAVASGRSIHDLWLRENPCWGSPERNNITGAPPMGGGFDEATPVTCILIRPNC
jgi:hypothetical protein